MKYQAWIKYPEKTISIHDFDGKYRCNEYALEATTRRSFTDCDTSLELKFFLLSFPNAPKKEILNLIVNLQKKAAERKISRKK